MRFLILNPNGVHIVVAHLTGFVFPENQLDTVFDIVRVVGVGRH